MTMFRQCARADASSTASIRARLLRKAVERREQIELAEVMEQREREDCAGLPEGGGHVGRDQANYVAQLSE
jgi:hypothetical protein